MVIQVVRYVVPPGQETEFEEAWRQASKPLARSTHCLGYSLTRATVERNRYLLMVYWDTPDGHRIAFGQSADFAEVQRLTEPFAGSWSNTSSCASPGHRAERRRPTLVSPAGEGRWSSQRNTTAACGTVKAERKTR